MTQQTIDRIGLAGHELAEAMRAAVNEGYRVQSAFTPEQAEQITVSDTAKTLGQDTSKVIVNEAGGTDPLPQSNEPVRADNRRSRDIPNVKVE
jgi:hypothetical protein